MEELLRRFPDATTTPAEEFLGAQFDLGLAWVHFDIGSGGLGLPAEIQTYVDALLKGAGAPDPLGDYMGMHQASSAIHRFGTAEQRDRFLRRIFIGEDHWCQLFSEPGAGSDLAGLSTLAEKDGDQWRVSGQKVWTSGAREADWGILVARTDPEAPKHRGLTFFICDMAAEGIEVRPLRQADGNATFSEVFLSDVRIPDALRVGEEGQGWAVSVHALHSERGGTASMFRRSIERLLDCWRSASVTYDQTFAVRRDRVVRTWIEDRVTQLLVARLAAGVVLSGAPQGGSMAKIMASEATQRLSECMVSLMGPGGQVGFDYDQPSTASMSEGIPDNQMLVIRARAMSIEGGSNEIQRRILAEQLLGLPAEPNPFREASWRDIPRS